MRSFTAAKISATEVPELNAFVIVLAEHEDGEGMHLEIQQALSHDAQDKKLGMDTYCISTEEGATHYGGVESWMLTGGVLNVRLDERARHALGTDGFIVDVNGDDEAQQALRDGMRRVCEGPH